MSVKSCSVKVWSKTETNIVSLLLTFLSDIWKCFLPEKVGIKSLGMKLRKWKYVFFPDFLGSKTKGVSHIEPQRKDLSNLVTKSLLF